MSTTSSDRRRAERHQVILDITMNLGGAAPAIHGRSVDVSRTGIFIMTDARIPEGRRVDLMITGDDGNPLLTSGTVVHCVGQLGVGVRFSNQTDFTIRRLEQLIDAHYARVEDLHDDTQPCTNPPLAPNRSREIDRG